MRPRSAVGLGAGFLLALACTGVRQDVHAVPDEPTAALYRARFEPGRDEKIRRFRLLVYASEPDRLHAEVLSSLGTTELVLDAGPAGVSVLFVRDRVAYVGAADERALNALLGVALSPEDLVGVLRGGQPRSSDLVWSVVPGRSGYPRSVRLSDGERRLFLELKRLRPMRADLQTLGTGRPPEGVELRSLEQLDPDSLPGIETKEQRR